MKQLGCVLFDHRFTFWAIVGHSLREQAGARGCSIDLRYAGSIAAQAAAIRQLIRQGVDVLVIGAASSHGLERVMQEAHEANIPVVAIDTEIADGDVACTVRVDSVAGTQLLAAFMASRLAGRGQIAHLSGPLAASSATQRAAAFEQALAAHAGLQIVHRASGDWTRESGQALARAALAEHPEIAAIFAANDPMALGAADVVAAAERQILVAGFDALPDTLGAIQAGHLAATVRQSPDEQGRLAVDAALALVAGQPVPALICPQPSLVTAENVSELAFATLDLLPGVLRGMAESAEALARERSLLDTFVNALPDTHAFVKDRQSRFVLLNNAHLATLGYARPEQVLGKTDFDLFPEHLAAQYFADEQAVMQAGTALMNRVEPVIRPDGAQKWYLTTKVPLRDADDQVIGLIGLSRDITALKQAEDDRTRLQAEVIENQQRALRELSTPLIPINNQTMVMPLIGMIDGQRAQLIVETLLQGVAQQHSHLVIVDITGVPLVDTYVADTLLRASQAVRLLGTQIILTGIRPEIAQTLVGLGVDLSSITTLRALPDGIAYALRRRVRG